MNTRTWTEETAALTYYTWRFCHKILENMTSNFKQVTNKIFMLDLPTKITRWLSDFLVGRVIQVNLNGFLSNQINPKSLVFTWFFPEFTTLSYSRQRSSKTAPQTKLTIPALR